MTSKARYYIEFDTVYGVRYGTTFALRKEDGKTYASYSYAIRVADRWLNATDSIRGWEVRPT